MNKTDVVHEVALKAGTTKITTEKVIKELLSTIMDAVAAGDRVIFVGFGTFELKHTAVKAGRNPQTGEPLTIPEKSLPKFKPGSDFKKAVATQNP